MTASGMEAASTTSFAVCIPGGSLKRLWCPVRFTNQQPSGKASACAYLEILTEDIETFVVLSYFEES